MRIFLFFGIPMAAGYYLASKTKSVPPLAGAAVGFAIPTALIVHAMRKFT